MTKFSELQKELVRVAVAAMALTVIVSAFAAQAVTVVQKDRRFQTTEITIAAGDSVNFTNEDPYVHHLFTNAPEFSFNSEEQETGEPLSVTFPVAGEFEVRCEIHPKMVLKVNVT